jgi:hypothetical protein
MEMVIVDDVQSVRDKALSWSILYIVALGP